MEITSATVTLKGVGEMITKLEQLKQIDMDIAAGAYTIAEEVMTVSKEVVPVDTGTLKSSGFVKPPEIAPTHVSVTLGYGGPARAYAWNQEYGGWHNLVAWGHPKGPYYPMHHPPKWAVAVMSNPTHHSPHVLMRASHRMAQQIGQAHFLEDPFQAARQHFYDEMEHILAAKIKELGLG